jgi:hypothetical protein
MWRSSWACALLFAAAAAAQAPQKTWRQTLDDRLRVYGHRNWIVVADSAYPLQSNGNAPHLRPVVYTDKELGFVSEDDAVGIGAYRQLLTGLFEKYLPDQKIATIPHVLVVTTNMALPYSTDDAERRLRESIK